jgi:hypothetical protein
MIILVIFLLVMNTTGEKEKSVRKIIHRPLVLVGTGMTTILTIPPPQHKLPLHMLVYEPPPVSSSKGWRASCIVKGQHIVIV